MSFDKKLTVSYFRKKKKNGEKIVSLTAYDTPTAQMAEDAGVELILVGDSLAMAVLGYQNTIRLSLEESLHHCSAVCRGSKNSFVVGDMPFMTYQTSIEKALENAARYLQEAGTDGVKVEGGVNMAPTIERLVGAGVPVMGHIGLQPQSLLTSGGYKVTGKTEEDAKRLVKDAQALENAGAFCIVLECMPSEVSKRITEMIKIPTIGIGAGPYCDGQVQVLNDILGLFNDFVPKHTKRYADLRAEIGKALSEYAKEVRDSKFPSEEQSF